MKLHVFNPEHEMVLARNDKYAVVPAAGRCLRADLGFIPAVWADEGDVVLVDDVSVAERSVRKMGLDVSGIKFLSKEQALIASDSIDAVDVWGWDVAVRHYLTDCGIRSDVMPDDAQLDVIRQMSHREFSMPLLHDAVAMLRQQGVAIIGESRVAKNEAEVDKYIYNHKQIILKAPWNSSGRGVCRVDGMLEDGRRNWMLNIIKQQGCVMMEPYYNKVLDFGMEWMVSSDGAAYCGLSLFSTLNGNYLGNVICDEVKKELKLSKYININDLYKIRKVLFHVISKVFVRQYEGPLGVDMMIVNECKTNGCTSYCVHPLVEINLRRTMGHVAIDLMRFNVEVPSSFHIVYTGNHCSAEIRKLDR